MKYNCFDVYNLRMHKRLKEETETIAIFNDDSFRSITQNCFIRRELKESTSL